MKQITFPEYQGTRCLMMPYVQGDPDSVPDEYAAYRDILSSTYLEPGAIGYLTIDESPVKAGNAHRGYRSTTDRALHTEAGLGPYGYGWGDGGGVWGGRPAVLLEADLEIILANSIDNSCAYWDATHADTSADGDIGYAADMYPYDDAVFMQAGDVHRIGIFTPHESIPVAEDANRQFLRIIGAGVHGREPYFTVNPLMEVSA